MPSLVQKSTQCERDIEESFVYIAENDLDRGVYFLVAVEDSLTLLSENPEMGWSRSFKDSRLNDLRIWRVRGFVGFLFVYRYDKRSDTILIIRFLNSKRDFDQIDL